MEKNFYIQLKSKAEYTECLTWFKTNTKDPVNKLGLEFTESYCYFWWDNSNSDWRLTHNKPKCVNCYTWENFQVWEDSIKYVGRYLKALVNHPISINTIKKGMYALKHTIHGVDDLQGGNWSMHEVRPSEWEVMPEGWTPNATNDKLIIGKWYVLTGITHANYYIKYSRNQDNQNLWFDEKIFNNEYQKVHDWALYEKLPVLVTDLSVLQEFLPNGHPDKIQGEILNQFIKGEWYEDFVFSTTKARFDCLKNGKFIGDCWIDSNGKYRGEEFTTNTFTHTKHISKESIQEFLPDGHQDKIVTLQKGKWYKVCLTTEWYLKFDKLSDGFVIASEYINIAVGGHSSTNGTFGRITDNVFTLVTDLMDLINIQRSLPNGHVDKIPTIVINSTYGACVPSGYYDVPNETTASVVEEPTGLRLLKSKRIEINLLD